MCTSQPESPISLDTCERIDFTMEPPPPESITPEKLPNPWLADSEWLLEELAKVRNAILGVPFSLTTSSDINSVVDRVWRLEQNLRYLLHLHRDGQRSFAKRAAAASKRNVHITKKPKIVRMQA
jgi:hypothetical protein